MREKVKIGSSEFTNDSNTIRIGSKHKGRYVIIGEIIYLEAYQNYTFLHLQNGERLVSGKCLKYYENLLTNQDFTRIHRSFLVNLIHIKEYEKKYRLLHLSDNRVLSVSYRKKTNLSKIINNKELLQAAKEVA